MKKIFILLVLLPVASTVFGQITINAADMPVPSASYNLRDISTSAAANPTVGSSAAWDYSAYAGTATTNAYTTETDTFFTSAGVDVYYAGFKSLISGLGYNYFAEIDFNASNVKESGIDILPQGYSLTAMTGGASDSLTIPAQKTILTTGREIVRFPFTSGTNWSSVSHRATTFYLTVAGAFLSHAPAEHRYDVHKTDTIVGWGKMRVYTTSGPSIQYDVLMDKSAQYAVDSFYLSGAPASPTVLSFFGVHQGQVTDSSYRYNFYRKTSFNYLLTFNYGNDATYTTPSAKYMHSDNITPANVGVNEVNDVAFSTVLFPNPANSNEVNLLINGKDVTGGQYFVTDMSGKTIQAGAIEMKAGALHVTLGDNVANGNYFLSVTNSNNVKVVTEQFTIAQ